MIKMAMADILQLLNTGTLEVEGLLPWSSNYTFLLRVCDEVAGAESEVRAVYKPRRGERPLWDFPQGTLCLREQAAYLISEAATWQLVPPTVLRKGPNGLGSLQLFVMHDPDCHYFTFEGEPAHRKQLQQIALLDVIMNNADRKSGHVLLQKAEDSQGEDRLWAIDHGICFHTDPKLRTVIWEFAGIPIPDELLQQLKNLKQQLEDKTNPLRQNLQELLTSAEITACLKRLQQLIECGKFPEPGPGRHYPWPPV